MLNRERENKTSQTNLAIVTLKLLVLAGFRNVFSFELRVVRLQSTGDGRCVKRTGGFLNIMKTKTHFDARHHTHANRSNSRISNFHVMIIFFGFGLYSLVELALLPVPSIDHQNYSIILLHKTAETI